jgi:anti-sigma B factor antagonist
LDIGVERVGHSEAVVVVRGELDCATADQLRAAITALLNRRDVDTIGLDLRGLALLDSTGIGTLVAAQRICEQVGVRLRLTAVSAFGARVLGVTGLDTTFGLPTRPAQTPSTNGA